jgi:hypothetical protein
VHAPAWHVDPAGHLFPQTPQFAASVARTASHPSAAFKLQSAVPALHWKVHALFVQSGVAFGGVGHTVHAGPHAAGSVATVQPVPHLLKPALHVYEHLPPTHSLVALATAGHAALQAPQWFSLVAGSTHSAPQRSGAVAGQPVVHAKLAPLGAHTGAVAGQTALQAPQLVAFERSASQPFAGFLSQSEKPVSHVATTHVRPWQADAACVRLHGVQAGLPQP